MLWKVCLDPGTQQTGLMIEPIRQTQVGTSSWILWNRQTTTSWLLEVISISYLCVVISFLSLWQKQWEKQPNGRNYLFCLMVLEVSVHCGGEGMVELSYLYYDGQETEKNACTAAFSFFPFYFIQASSLCDGTSWGTHIQGTHIQDRSPLLVGPHRHTQGCALLIS
jgi:hypothetical protein